jgi:hypothetical protein
MLHKHGATLGVALVGVVALVQWWLTGVIFVPFNPYLLLGIGLLAVGVWKRIRPLLFAAEGLAWVSVVVPCCMPPSLIRQFYSDITERMVSWWVTSSYVTLLVFILLVRSARASAPKEAEKAAPVDEGADQAP